MKTPSLPHAAAVPTALVPAATTATVPTLTALRRLLPRRAISYGEALAVAEQQANRLSATWGLRSVQEVNITALSRIEIERRCFDGDESHSGSSRYDQGRWIISLDEREPVVRQRFTICHELKHLVDSPHQSSYRNLTDAQIERVCDHFAACLLMNKRAIYQFWGDGLRTPEALASACRVSLTAMRIRLERLGLPVNRGIRQAFSCRRSYPEASRQQGALVRGVETVAPTGQLNHGWLEELPV